MPTNAEYQKKWREANPEKHASRIKANTKKSVARKLAMIDNHLSENICSECGGPPSKFVIDGKIVGIRKMAHNCSPDARIFSKIEETTLLCDGCFANKASTSNKRKAKFLGIPSGTAYGQLRKSIMFRLVQQTEQDSCYRCGEKIESEKDLSIEHKIAWLDNSVELFWDLDNIAFSHLGCNRPGL